MKYSKYPSYRDSGIEWLGDVPATWEILPARSIVSNLIKKNENAKDQRYLSLMAKIGVIRYEDKGDIGNKKPDNLAKCKVVHKGNLVINSMNYSIGSYGMSSYDGVCSPVYVVLEINKDKLYPTFGLRLFENKAYQRYMASFGNGILAHRSAIGWEEIKGSYMPLPPLQEQQIIANYLDNAIAKIDILIEKQTKLIALLKEKRQAVISTAVTRGLDSTVAMKDSGIEWLGAIPEHWILPQIARILLLMEQGKSPECDNNVADIGAWGVLKTSCVNNAIYNSEANKTLPSSIKPFTQYEVKEEDILMSRASGSINLIGSVAYVYKTRPKILLSDKIFRLYVDKSVNKIFFSYLMGSEYMRTNIKMAISGGEGMANNIAKSSITKFKMALPSADEQNLIVKYIDDKTSKIDNLINKSTKAIDLLKEKRIALISSAVTGKIDLRESM